MGGSKTDGDCEVSIYDNKFSYSQFGQYARIGVRFGPIYSSNILWINGYFPTDPQLINFDETDLQIVLNEVEKTMECSQYDALQRW